MSNRFKKIILSTLILSLTVIIGCNKINDAVSGSSDETKKGGSGKSALFEGNGTFYKPYILNEVADLDSIMQLSKLSRDSLKHYMKAHFALKSNINAAPTDQWNNRKWI